MLSRMILPASNVGSEIRPESPERARRPGESVSVSPWAPVGTARLLVFTLDGERHALEVARVVRVLPAVLVRELPGAPAVVRGVFMLAGRLVPLVDPRQPLGRPGRDLRLDDVFVLADTGQRVVALWVDADVKLRDVAEAEIHSVRDAVGEVGKVRGVAQLASGLVLIHDLERFLSADDEGLLASALAAAEGGGA